MSSIQSDGSGEIRFGRFRVDLERRELLFDGRLVRLGGRPLDILSVLASAGGAVVSKDELLQRLWPGRAVEEGNLHVHVSALRRALGENGHSYVVTVPGRGYRLAGLDHSGPAEVDKPQNDVSVVADTPHSGLAEAAFAQAAASSPEDVRVLERRQLTIVSCELIGAARLATLLDPEDLSTVISGFYRRCGDVIASFGGSAAHADGGTVRGEFGYPRTGEHDVEKAIQAGLALIDAVDDLKYPGFVPKVRVGIATGPVVIGALMKDGGSDDSLIGETVSLAAALRRTADPGTVVIAESSSRHVGDLFKVERRNVPITDDFDAPVVAYRVLHPSTRDSRFEALRGPRLTSMVGRDEEIEILLRRWQRVKSGELGVVLITGEAGIGKSRLCAELRTRIRHQPHTCIRYFCSPHHQGSVLYPVIRQLEVAAGFADGDALDIKLTKLRSLLAREASASEEDASLLANMMSLATGPFPELTARRRRALTFDALIRQLDFLAARSPVLITFEDAHWSDPTTLELLDLVLRNTVQRPVLVLITYRPEFVAPWTGQPHVTAVTLNRLDRRNGAAMVRRVMGSRTLPNDLIDAIVERTDGVPLFIEELTKAMLEGALQGRSTVPATLQASLTARLDRLPRAKQVAQVGAVIGRDFSYGLLAEAAGLPEAQLRDGINGLVAAGLVTARGNPPEAKYTFKHALVQDVAYESLLRSRRAGIHAAIVAACERAGPCNEPGILAHHSAEAGLRGKAAHYYRIAAERSIERAAVAETRGQLQRGLAFAANLAQGNERDALEAELLLALATVLQTAESMSNAAAGELFSRAAAASRRLAQPKLVARTLWGQFTNVLVRGDVAAAEELAQQLLETAQAFDEVHTQLAAGAAMGIALYYQGHFESARAHLARQQSILEAQLEPEELDWRTTIAGPAFLALTLACLGYLEQAAVQLDRAIALTCQKGPFALAYCLSVAVRVLIVLRDDNGLRKHATRLVAVSEEGGFHQFLSQGLCALGWLEAKAGSAPQRLDRLRQGLAGMVDRAVLVSLPFYRSLLADVLPAGEGLRERLILLDSALELSARTNDHWFTAELHRMRGELLGDPSHAETELLRALTLAREESARLWELRAAISLARLWEKQGRRREAHDLLAPVYHWFTEGFATPDLQAARQVLAELGAQPVIPRKQSRSGGAR